MRRAAGTAAADTAAPVTFEQWVRIRPLKRRMDVKYVAAAAAYVAARDAGIAVLEAIADALNVDRRTAARYVKRARELGYLVED